MPSLSRHPDWPSDAVTDIRAEAIRHDGRLSLRYLATRGARDPIIPPPAEPARTDGLWRHTCFEAFIRPSDGAAYVEFNLAPSGQWAAYRFSGYREGMAPLEIPAPRIAWRTTDQGYAMEAELDLSAVADLAGRSWDVALSAVIEEPPGRTSYWALAHPPGKADFHHGAGFALSLPDLRT